MNKIYAPRRAALFKEGLGLIEIPRLLWQIPQLRAQPKGNGEAVLVLPGFGTSDTITTMLRTYLNYLGYQAQPWKLGRNHGNVQKLLPKVLGLIEAQFKNSKKNLKIVGWSLGGYLAREAAREKPEWVDRVITLGTPVIGGPKYTVVAKHYQDNGHDLDHIEKNVASRNEKPIQVPVTAIFSKSDGVVAWQACIDQTNQTVEHIEVKSTHLGLGFSPEVYQIIAQKLAKS